jgi:hypothetical protein
MEIVFLKRAHSSKTVTLGMITVSGVEHEPIYTLENPQRSTKKDSRIPAGIYTCEPYSGTKYKNVYIVTGVPGRTAILFHWGNTEKDTAGCILLGLKTGRLDGAPAVLSSKKAFNYFKSLIGNKPFKLVVS